MRLLHLVFHPYLHTTSRVHKLLSSFCVADHPIVDIAALYPSYEIDVPKEQQRLLNADRIVFEFPMFWYSMPAIMKKWVDDVLTHGFAYGPNGDKLKGKEVILCFSTGRPFEDYTHTGAIAHTPLELLAHLKYTFDLCQLVLRDSYIIHGVRHLSDVELQDHATNMLDFITKP